MRAGAPRASSAATGSVAAPTATASGPSWHSSIDVWRYGCASACAAAAARISGSSRDQSGDLRLLVRPWHGPPAPRPPVPVEHPFGAHVSLEAPACATAAAAPPVRDGGVAPLARAAAGPPVGGAVGHHGRADTGADQRDHGVP